MADTLGQTNPIRYRGYYYDTETGLYYLQSRYYDPVTHRFINADGLISTGQGILGINMFAYCGNNPISRKDTTGQGWLSTIIIVASVVVAVAAVVASVIAVTNSDPSPTEEFNSIDEATEYWASTYRKESQEKEHGAIIYKQTDKNSNKTTYTIGRTYLGENDNFVLGFTVGYASGGISSLFSSKEMVAFIHSHPEEPGWHQDRPSDVDLFLLNLPGINEVYIVPWDSCEGIPGVIKGSDKSSWKHDYIVEVIECR